MSSLGLEYLHHILEETTYLIAQAQGVDQEAFLRDETLKRAFVRSLEVIGEAVKHVPEALRQQYLHSRPFPVGKDRQWSSCSETAGEQ
jgi:uncharacterized protein with HEPN domain